MRDCAAMIHRNVVITPRSIPISVSRWRVSIMMVIMAVVAAKMAPASVDLAQSSSEWVTSPV